MTANEKYKICFPTRLTSAKYKLITFYVNYLRRHQNLLMVCSSIKFLITNYISCFTEANIYSPTYIQISKELENPLDVTVAYVSEINKSKTIKYLNYLRLRDTLPMWGPSRNTTLESLTMTSRWLWWSDDLSMSFVYGISFAINR